MQRLSGATNEFPRYLALDRAAKMSLAVGRTKDAQQFATDLLVLDQKFRQNSPSQVNGDAMYQANVVLGTLALNQGHIEQAKRHLLAAGETNGSPVLGSFGPNMSLAKELLESGEQETVLNYLEQCRKFWSSGTEKLDEWTKSIEAGQFPDFGSNLFY